MVYFKQSVKILLLVFLFFPYLTAAARPINGTVPESEPVLPPPISETENTLLEDVNVGNDDTHTPSASVESEGDAPAPASDVEPIGNINISNESNPWIYIIGSILLGILGIVFLLKNKK